VAEYLARHRRTAGFGADVIGALKNQRTSYPSSRRSPGQAVESYHAVCTAPDHDQRLQAGGGSSAEMDALSPANTNA